VDIAEKLQQAKLTAKEIEDARVKYSGAARRGAVLFFVMVGLANVNKMYEYSLSSFLTVFSNTLATSKKDALLEARLRNIIEATTSDVYNYTCLGLFEKHKLMFSFQVCPEIAHDCMILRTDTASLDFSICCGVCLNAVGVHQGFPYCLKTVSKRSSLRSVILRRCTKFRSECSALRLLCKRAYLLADSRAVNSSAHALLSAFLWYC
jgi:hypothetical protein